MSFQAVFIPRNLIVRLLISAMLGLLPVLASAAIYTVNTKHDNEIDDSFCTLREAIQRATNNQGEKDCGEGYDAENEIVFTDSMTIKLTVNEALNVNNRLTIDAQQYGVTIDGDGQQIFRLTSNKSDLSLFNMILRNGNSGGAGGAVYVQHQDAKFTATQVRFVLNSASTTGGAIHSEGHLQLTNVIFDVNEAGSHGGAIYARNGDLFLTNIEFVGNSAQGNGGAMMIDSTTTSQQNVALVAVDYTGNTANGDANQESGGGALWLKNSGDNDVRFLLMLNTFTNNTAPNGNGGALLVANGSEINFPDEMELEDFVQNTLPKLATYLGSGTFNPSSFNPHQWLDTGVLLAEGLYSVHFTGNVAGGDGGALYNRGTTSILSSSFQGNSSGQDGGSIAHNSNQSSLTLANTTLVHNSALNNGSAIANLSGFSLSPVVELINDTVAYNQGNSAIYSTGFSSIRALNSLLAHNTSTNCQGAIDADTSNLQYAPNSGCGSAWVADPELFAAPAPGVGLSNVVTILPFLDNSPANGAGDSGICAAAPIFNVDARGLPFTRPGLMEEGTNCDIGAYESMGSALIHSTGLDFERVFIGSYLDKDAVLINTSNRDYSTMGLTITGLANQNPFSIVNETCSGSLSSGESCTVTVRFKPTRARDYFNQLSVKNGSPFIATVDEIPLTGYGRYKLVEYQPTRPVVVPK